MEANSLCERLDKAVHFSVTLRIPPERLGPSVEPEKWLLCSAAIKLVRPGREDSIWPLDKLEDRMSELRAEIYSMEGQEEEIAELSFASTPMAPPLRDPFYEEQQQSLIGVASFYLESLFYDLDEPFEYVAPIVSPNGTSAGKLALRMERVSGFLPLTEEKYQADSELTVRVELVKALGLSPTLAHFVECQYTFPGTGENCLSPAANRREYVAKNRARPARCLLQTLQHFHCSTPARCTFCLFFFIVKIPKSVC